MKSWLFVCLFFAVPLFTHAGITVSERLFDGQSVSYFQNGFIASYSNNKLDTLIDVKNKTVHTVDYESEMIMYGTFDDMKEMQKIAAKQIQDISQDEYYKQQNELIKKLKIKAEKQKSKKFAGYPCEAVILSIDGYDISTEICYSKELLDDIAKEVDIASFLNIVGSTPIFYISADELLEAETAKYASKGFSLYEKKVTPDFNGSTKTEVSEVVSIKKGEIPAKTFELPASLTKVKMTDLMSHD